MDYWALPAMRSQFDIADTPLQGLRLIHRNPIMDSRGYLERVFCAQELQALILGKRIIQINHTLTVKRGTVRGMHFQWPPHAEIKFVSCIRGEVFDVAVDVRKGFDTFLRWHGEILSADNHRTMVIPEGFAHGFQTLTDNCEMIYFHTAVYRAESEGALNAVDPLLAIDWPRLIEDRSPRDAAQKLLDGSFQGVVL